MNSKKPYKNTDAKTLKTLRRRLRTDKPQCKPRSIRNAQCPEANKPESAQFSAKVVALVSK